MMSIHGVESPHQVGKSTARFAVKAGQAVEKHQSFNYCPLCICVSQPELLFATSYIELNGEEKQYRTGLFIHLKVC